MTSPNPTIDEKAYLVRSIEASIRIGVVALLVATCFLITRPFILPIIWGAIVATALYPAYTRAQSALGGRPRLTAVLFAALGLLLLLVPAFLSAGSLVDSAQWLLTSLGDGTLTIPPPPDDVATWPLVGERLHASWQLANQNLDAALKELGPYLAPLAGTLLSSAAGLGLGIVQFGLSIVIAAVLLASAQASVRVAAGIATRLAGARGAEFAELAGATVRSVAQGIIGVAVIQSGLIGLGILAAGIPHGALWTALCLLLAVIQLPPFLVVLPLIAYVFSTDSTTSAVLFTIWSVLAGASDNVLKPILLGRGLELPMVVIFMGSLGGFVAFGFVGLFIGAVILGLGYELFLAWLDDAASVD